MIRKLPCHRPKRVEKLQSPTKIDRRTDGAPWPETHRRLRGFRAVFRRYFGWEDTLRNQWHKHSFPKALNSSWPLRRNIRQHKAGISRCFFLTAENAEENTDDYSKILDPLPAPSPCEGDRGCIWLQRTAAIAQFPAAFCPRVSRCLCVAALPPTSVCVKASLNGVESARFAMTKKSSSLLSSLPFYPLKPDSAVRCLGVSV